MEVFLIFPKSQQAQQKLREELAKFQSEQALKSVQKLPCSTGPVKIYAQNCLQAPAE